jgi:DNA-binding NarL/FixJ family response regulator
MPGGTLMVSRAESWFDHFKRRLEELGFPNVAITSLESDALDMLISDLKPDLVLMGARFYECCTPYMLGELKRRFPNIDMAALSISKYPPELAMYFIVNGAMAYATAYYSPAQWYEGLKQIREGKIYIAPVVQEKINARNELPMPAMAIKGRLLEITRCACCGFKDIETARCLGISERTVDKEKQIVYRSLNVRNAAELLRAALTLKMVTQEEINFFPDGFSVMPRADK